MTLTFDAKSSDGEKLTKITFEGNYRVEDDALKQVLSSKVNFLLDRNTVQKDIRELYNLNFFSEIDAFLEPDNGGVHLIFQLKEKPSITEIKFIGFDEFEESDLRDDLLTKLYTIANEASVKTDVRNIEKKYRQKGFYLIRVSSEIKEHDTGVSVIFSVQEASKLNVGDFKIIGNNYFSELDLLDKIFSRPFTNSTAIGSNSLFQEDILKRDAEFLAFYYRDHGFADVRVAQPIVFLDSDKRFARITFTIEEGTQYRVNSIRVTGDVGKDFYTEEFLISKMKLKKNELFKHTSFTRDVETIVDKYGDLGYASVDVNPKTKFNKESGLLDLIYEIKKGEKVYFGQVNITGNTKTRDNVIRREIEISDAKLYSGTKLSESKRKIERLGFFEEVQLIKQRRSDKPELVDVQIKVKEKSTGQLQAQLGYNPGGQTRQSFFGQGRYDEKNQFGQGWTTTLGLKWAASNDYKFDLSFSDPKVNDSDWSLAFNISYAAQKTRYALLVEVPETRFNTDITLGRRLFELVRGSVSIKHSNINQEESFSFFNNGKVDGIQNSMIFSLTRNDLNNYLDPSDGLSMSISHKLTMKILAGDYQFMETLFNLNYYIPFDFTSSFRTYVKNHISFGFLSTLGDEPLPQLERYRLGGFNDLRGYAFSAISPIEKRGNSPMSEFFNYQSGGDRKFLYQFEYFIPLIPEAGIKTVLFADAGQVFNEGEDFTFKDLHYDVGFGFRWITPIAPFRFEWAYPYDKDKGDFGSPVFIFTLGY